MLIIHDFGGRKLRWRSMVGLRWSRLSHSVSRVKGSRARVTKIVSHILGARNLGIGCPPNPGVSLSPPPISPIWNLMNPFPPISRLRCDAGTHKHVLMFWKSARENIERLICTQKNQWHQLIRFWRIPANHKHELPTRTWGSSRSTGIFERDIHDVSIYGYYSLTWLGSGIDILNIENGAKSIEEHLHYRMDERWLWDQNIDTIWSARLNNKKNRYIRRLSSLDWPHGISIVSLPGMNVNETLERQRVPTINNYVDVLPQPLPLVASCDVTFRDES